MADVDPSEYDTEQEENVLLEELYPRVLLTEQKTNNEKDDLDLDLDLLNDDPGVNAGNDNEDTPDKKKRRKETTLKGAPQPSTSKAIEVITIGASEAPVKSVTNKTPTPPNLVKAPHVVPSNVPPRAQINPLPPLTPAPPPPKEVKKEKPQENEFHPRGQTLERRSRSRERRSRSGSSRDHRDRGRPAGEQHQVVVPRRDRNEDADLRDQLKRRGHHGGRRPGPGPGGPGPGPPISGHGPRRHPGPGAGHREWNYSTGPGGPSPQRREEDPALRGDRGRHGMGHMDYQIRDGGEYRRMERGAHEGGVEGRNGRGCGPGHERYRYPGPPDFRQVKADYQDRFITPADSDQARADFSLAQQGADESLLEFHSRLRELFTRAYPAAMGNIDGAPMRQILRDRFILGLLHPAIKEYTWDQRPANYMECLAVVQRKQATLQLLSPSPQGPNSQTNRSSTDPRSQAQSSVYTAGASTFGTGSHSAGMNFACHFCKTTGHMLRQCPLLDQARSII